MIFSPVDLFQCAGLTYTRDEPGLNRKGRSSWNTVPHLLWKLEGMHQINEGLQGERALGAILGLGVGGHSGKVASQLQSCVIHRKVVVR